MAYCLLRDTLSGVLISLLFFSCKTEKRSSISHESAFKEIRIEIIDNYKNNYDENNKLTSSILISDSYTYYASGEKDIFSEEQIIQYFYNSEGNLIRKDTHKKNENILVESELYKYHDGKLTEIERYEYEIDASSYRKETYNEQGKFLIQEIKETVFRDDMIKDVHFIKRASYDKEKRLSTIFIDDLVNKTSEKVSYKYELVSDTLVSIVTDEYQILKNVIKEIIQDEVTIKLTYDNNVLEEKQDTYFNNSKIILIATHNYKENRIDSFFYSQEEKEVKYVSINFENDNNLTVFTLYDDFGNISKVEHVVTPLQ